MARKRRVDQRHSRPRQEARTPPRIKNDTPPTSPGSLGELIAYIVPRFRTRPDEVLLWPADIFAVCASILARTGAYSCVAQGWPPDGMKNADWRKHTRERADEWRATLGRKPPRAVVDAWRIIKHHSNTSLGKIRSSSQICNALIFLIAVSDEACRGLGIPPRVDEFEDIATLRLAGLDQPGVSTLCTRTIDASKVRVLPKLHTPPTGLTIRSLSHHLAWIPVRDV